MDEDRDGQLMREMGRGVFRVVLLATELGLKRHSPNINCVMLTSITKKPRRPSRPNVSKQARQDMRERLQKKRPLAKQEINQKV